MLGAGSAKAAKATKKKASLDECRDLLSIIPVRAKQTAPATYSDTRSDLYFAA